VAVIYRSEKKSGADSNIKGVSMKGKKSMAVLCRRQLPGRKLQQYPREELAQGLELRKRAQGSQFRYRTVLRGYSLNRRDDRVEPRPVRGVLPPHGLFFHEVAIERHCRRAHRRLREVALDELPARRAEASSLLGIGRKRDERRGEGGRIVGRH
jgi:hypothetical protein